MRYHSAFTYLAFYFVFLYITRHVGNQAVNAGDDTLSALPQTLRH